MDSVIFYSALQRLEMEFRRRNGRASTVDSSLLELQSESREPSTVDRDLSSRSSSGATEEDADWKDKSAATEDSGGRQLAAAAPATPTQEKTLVDSELIEKLLQEDTDRVRRYRGDTFHHRGFMLAVKRLK